MQNLNPIHVEINYTLLKTALHNPCTVQELQGPDVKKKVVTLREN